MTGWIKLHRKIAENRLWLGEPFTRGQAWVDLLLLANHEYGYFYVRDIKVSVQRGQVAWSEPKLALRWMWSRTKVRKFLNDMEKEQQLIQQKNNVTQILTIVNYEIYQIKEQQVIQQENSRKTAEEQQQDLNKNNKEEYKNNKEVITPPTPPKGVDSENQKIIDLFNVICQDMPKVQKVTDIRKKAIKVRLRENGEGVIKDAFYMAAASDFLNGRDGKGFVANFDWIMGPKNFVKVIEGNYNNRQKIEIRKPTKGENIARTLNNYLNGHGNSTDVSTERSYQHDPAAHQ